MKEDVVAANLANLRQSINELKECVNRQNVTPNQPEQHIKVDLGGKIKQQEILDSLERKGYAQEDFLGNLEVEPACIEILKPLYQGMYESELILREEAGESVHYKFHHMENRIT